MASKKQINIVITVAILLFSAVAIVLSSESPSKFVSSFVNKSISPTPDVISEDIQGSSTFVSKSPPEYEFPTQSISPDLKDSSSEPTYKVVKVVDGDTMDVDIDGKIERLRLIGIDTPETVDPRKTVQCFGREASKAAKELLTDQFVSLESDDTQGDRDKYKRLLRYIFLADGTNFNLFMIAEGYAHEYTYDQPYKYQTEFKQAEIDARNNSKGLWSSSTCSGNK